MLERWNRSCERCPPSGAAPRRGPQFVGGRVALSRAQGAARILRERCRQVRQVHGISANQGLCRRRNRSLRYILPPCPSLDGVRGSKPVRTLTPSWGQASFFFLPGTVPAGEGRFVVLALLLPSRGHVCGLGLVSAIRGRKKSPATATVAGLVRPIGLGVGMAATRQS